VRRPPPSEAAVSGLARRYRSRLDHPIPETADTPAGLGLPTPAEGYIEPSGRPGSGKSVLTRRLAARLAEADFLPVRVELRTVRTVRTVRTDAPVRTRIAGRLEYLLFGGPAQTRPSLAFVARRMPPPGDAGAG
jgi:hypothetical protein